MRYIEKKVEAARNFANKLWNATRFVLMNLPEDFTPGLPSEDKLDMSDKWVLTKLNQVAGAMTDNLDHYEMGLAAAKINSFIWDVYCDWFIEIAKPRLNSGDAEQADTARRVLVYVLDKALKLLHPFMPFITEELYQALPGSAETIMTQSWPTFDEAHNWADEEEAFEKVMDYIKAVRTMRTEMNVHPAKKTSMIIETADAAPFQKAQVYLAKFAFATEVTFTDKYEGSTDGMVQVSTHAARGFIPMMELIDRDKELARLNKEKAKAEKEMAMFANQLNNPSSWSAPRRHWWRISAISTPRARISWPTSSRASRLWADLSGEYNSSAQRTSPWVTAGRVIFTLALIGCIAFIFSNSMKIASVSTVSSGRVLTLLQAALRRLGHPALAQRLTDHIVRKLAHFCEYMLEGFLLMLCMRVYTRQYIWHISVPMLGGVLTALTDETIQIFSPGRSSQVTDVWLDSAGVLAGILTALVLMALCRLLFNHRNKE